MSVSLRGGTIRRALLDRSNKGNRVVSAFFFGRSIPGGTGRGLGASPEGSGGSHLGLGAETGGLGDGVGGGEGERGHGIRAAWLRCGLHVTIKRTIG